MKLNSDNTYNEIVEYLWLDDTPIAQIKTTYAANNVVSARRLTYIHADHLNTPRLMTDANKTVVWKWSGDAYGLIGPNSNPDGDSITDKLDLRFPGQIYDSESGLYYNMSRYYDPMLGRYTQSDPIGLEGGLNTYGYVSGNPISYVDPLGLDKIRIGPSGPMYGNWGGKNWSGGQFPSEHDGEMGNKRPVDSLDFCAQQHDRCWDKCDGSNRQCVNPQESQACKDICDEKFTYCLLKLDTENSKNWPVPPTPGTELDARLFQHGGIYLGDKKFFRH